MKQQLRLTTVGYGLQATMRRLQHVVDSEVGVVGVIGKDYRSHELRWSREDADAEGLKLSTTDAHTAFTSAGDNAYPPAASAHTSTRKPDVAASRKKARRASKKAKKAAINESRAAGDRKDKTVSNDGVITVEITSSSSDGQNHNNNNNATRRSPKVVGNAELEKLHEENTDMGRARRARQAQWDAQREAAEERRRLEAQQKDIDRVAGVKDTSKNNKMSPEDAEARERMITSFKESTAAFSNHVCRSCASWRWSFYRPTRTSRNTQKKLEYSTNARKICRLILNASNP